MVQLATDIFLKLMVWYQPKERRSTTPKLSGFHTSTGGGRVAAKLKSDLNIRVKEKPRTWKFPRLVVWLAMDIFPKLMVWLGMDIHETMTSDHATLWVFG